MVSVSAIETGIPMGVETMDPNATMKLIEAAYDDGKFDTMMDSAVDLIEWIDDGEFATLTLTANQLRTLLMMTINNRK